MNQQQHNHTWKASSYLKITHNNLRFIELIIMPSKEYSIVIIDHYYENDHYYVTIVSA